MPNFKQYDYSQSTMVVIDFENQFDDFLEKLSQADGFGMVGFFEVM